MHFSNTFSLKKVSIDFLLRGWFPIEIETQIRYHIKYIILKKIKQHEIS